MEWCTINTCSGSSFFGFDTFTGLPEDWTKGFKKGTFDVHGKIPTIDDTRVQLVQGMFQDTLRQYITQFNRNNQFVLHLDADLYSSTLYVLATLDPILEKGDIIMFDEFSSITAEFRAYMDYTNSFLRRLRLISKVQSNGWICDQVAFVVE